MVRSTIAVCSLLAPRPVARSCARSPVYLAITITAVMHNSTAPTWNSWDRRWLGMNSSISRPVAIGIDSPSTEPILPIASIMTMSPRDRSRPKRMMSRRLKGLDGSVGDSTTALAPIRSACSRSIGISLPVAASCRR
jgi:hypothetical protein